jgi:YVTN family beta-propeller protein
MHRRTLALAALAVLAVLSACSNDTAPDPTAGKTHPAGTVADRITFNSGHIGIAVASNGVAYASSPTGIDRFSTQSPYTKLSPIPTGPSPRDIVIDPAGTTAYAATDNGKVYVVDLVAGAMKSTFAVGDTTLYGSATQNKLALSRDGSLAYLSVWGRLWSIPTSGAAPTSVAMSANALGVSPSDGSIYVDNGDLTVWHVSPSTFLPLAKSTNVNGSIVAFAPRGDEVYVDGPSGQMHVLDPTTMAERAQLGFPSGVSGITVSPDGTQIYVALFDQRVAIVDRATRTVLSTLTLGGIPYGVAFDPQGTTAFVINLEGWVDVIR